MSFDFRLRGARRNRLWFAANLPVLNILLRERFYRAADHAAYVNTLMHVSKDRT